jgi:hypothetical protein
MKINKTFERITKVFDIFSKNGTLIYFFVHHKRKNKISKDILRIILVAVPICYGHAWAKAKTYCALCP